jgi:hypothetical protein
MHTSDKAASLTLMRKSIEKKNSYLGSSGEENYSSLPQNNSSSAAENASLSRENSYQLNLSKEGIFSR